MPQIFTAAASEVKVNEETLEGLQSIEYGVVKNRQHVGAIGTDERIAVYFGLKVVTGKLRLVSGSATLDRMLATNEEFSISAILRHRDATRHVSLDACYVDDKSFGLNTGGHAETVYTFTATRVREE